MLCCCGVEEPKKLEVATGQNVDEQKMTYVPMTPDMAQGSEEALIDQKLPASLRALGEDSLFEVRLDKRSSGSYGFSLEYDFKDALHADAKDPCLLLSLHGGAVQQWNVANPTQNLKVGDRIVEANGTRGASQAIFEIIKDSEQATLTVQRPKELKVPVKSCRSLGLDLAYGDSMVGLLIKQVNEGPVMQWNTSATDQVSPGDRIVTIKGGSTDTGTPEDAETLLKQLQAAEGEATLTILSWK